MNTLSNMSAIVNINSSCNAFYSGNRINFYRAGGGCNMTGYSSVIYHVWGHGADAAFGGISQTDGYPKAGATSSPTIDSTSRSSVSTSPRVAASSAMRATPGPILQVVGGTPRVKPGWALLGTCATNLASALGTSAGRARAEAIVVASIVADARTNRTPSAKCSSSTTTTAT